MGLIPVPGRFAARFSSVKASPLWIFLSATMLLRAIGLFFSSEGDAFFIPLPRAFPILRMARTMAFNSLGSSEFRDVIDPS